MKLDNIINLLKISGINSKKQVIDLLENASVNELIELKRDIKERICKKITNEKYSADIIGKILIVETEPELRNAYKEKVAECLKLKKQKLKLMRDLKKYEKAIEVLKENLKMDVCSREYPLYSNKYFLSVLNTNFKIGELEYFILIKALYGEKEKINQKINRLNF